MVKPAADWDLAKARPKSSETPMTSPVDFISGPSRMSVPGNFRNGKTDSLMKIRGTVRSSVMPCSRQAPARDDAGRHLGQGHARGLAHEGRRAGGAGVDLEDVDDVVLDGVLDVHQAAHVEGEAQAAACSRRIVSRWRGSILYEGSTAAESPLWMPASSMCCMIPPMTTRSPSATASTSTSKASSRKRSTRTGCSGRGLHGLPRVTPRGAPRRRRWPWPARPGRRTGAPAPGSRCARDRLRLVDGAWRCRSRAGGCRASRGAR